MHIGVMIAVGVRTCQVKPVRFRQLQCQFSFVLRVGMQPNPFSCQPAIYHFQFMGYHHIGLKMLMKRLDEKFQRTGHQH